MSDKVQAELMNYFASQGLSIDILASISSSEWESLPGPGGSSLNQIQKIIIKGKINQYKESQNNSSVNSLKKSQIQVELEKEKEKNRKLEQERDKLKVKKDRLKSEKSESKHRADEMVSRTLEISKEGLINVNLIMHEIREIGTNLDICFCIDATGSMSGLINNVKNCIINVCQKIESETGMFSRLALVLYRDYCDGSLRHQVWDFTNSSDFNSYLSTVTATGGGDGPEDCFGGLYAACTKVTWSSPSRIIFWFGDAPQHGQNYVDGPDDYPQGDPDGVTSNKIFEQLKLNKINLLFCRIKSYTDKMMAQLKKEIIPYGSNLLIEFKLEDDNIPDFLASSLVSTLELTTCCTSVSATEKTYSIMPATWEDNINLWRVKESCKIYTFRSYSGNFSDIHPLYDLLLDGPDTKKRNSIISVTFNPVANGEMRFAFYAKVTENSTLIGIKEEKKAISKESKFKGERNKKKYLIMQAKIQTLSIFLANTFNKLLEKLKIRERKIKYVKVELLYIPGRSKGNTYFTLEPYIEGSYLKFNNNMGFVNKPLEKKYPILQTFSHFTYSYSKGLVMVTDIQGVVSDTHYKLTDPAIHTSNSLIELSDPTNMGPMGIAAFFSSHTCNEFCLRMNLKTPDNIDVTTPLKNPSKNILKVIYEDEAFEDKA